MDSIKLTWSSVGITGTLKASLHKYQQGLVQAYDRELPASGSINVPPGRITPGRYFIRIEEINVTAKTDSGVFSIAWTIDKPNMIKKEPQTIEVTIPVQKRDRHSRRRRTSKDSYNAWVQTGLPQQPTHASRPSKARVGFENHWKRFDYDNHWYYAVFIYRSRLFFDVSQFKGKRESCWKPS